MLYLYTIMMLAWDLDNDTHSHFRRYLDVFINQRKISGCIRDFVRDTRSRAITAHIRPGYDTDSVFNELRISLPNRMVRERPSLSGRAAPCAVTRLFPKSSTMQWRYAIPKLIEDIHPSK